MLRAQDTSTITKNNSQGIIFVTISCQRVLLSNYICSGCSVLVFLFLVVVLLLIPPITSTPERFLLLLLYLGGKTNKHTIWGHCPGNGFCFPALESETPGRERGFFIESPRRGGGSPRRGGGGSRGQEGVCRKFGGGVLNIFFWGRNSHQRSESLLRDPALH